jgi:hypothetical protein
MKKDRMLDKKVTVVVASLDNGTDRGIGLLAGQDIVMLSLMPDGRVYTGTKLGEYKPVGTAADVIDILTKFFANAQGENFTFEDFGNALAAVEKAEGKVASA